MKKKTRRSQPRQSARKNITPAATRHRAARHVFKRLFKGAKVADGAEVRLGIYPGGNWKSAEVWIVYKNPENPMALKSSDIVVVTKRNGRVIYEGSASDEG